MTAATVDPVWGRALSVPVSLQASFSDSVRQDLARGRYWKASSLLRARLAPIESATFEDRILLAEAEAGWKNWEGAVAALSAGPPDPAQAPPRYWYVLGTALHAAGEDGAAARSFARFVREVTGESREGLVARSRLIRAAAATQSVEATVEAAGELRALAVEIFVEIGFRTGLGAGVFSHWTALAAAREFAAAGEVAGVVGLLELITDPAIRQRGWALEVDAWLAAGGDTARALEALNRVELPEEGLPTRLELLNREWRYRLALGDTSGAVSAMEGVLVRTTRGADALQAALALRRIGTGLNAEVLRRVARALANGGEYGPAIRAWRAAVDAGAVLSDQERLARGRAYNGSGDLNGAVREYRELAESSDPAVGAPALRAWSAIRRRQGRPGDARTLEDRLVARFPERQEALDVVFFRGDDHHDRGHLDEALDHYRQVVSMSPSADRAGLARMRWGQIHLARDELAAAARVYQGYLEEFPQGRRWEEASYWSARIAEIIGDTLGAARLIVRLRDESPFSYYTFLADRAQGREFAPNLPEDPLLPGEPRWLEQELEVVALLEEAGLDEGAAAHVGDIKALARYPDDLLHFAVAFNERGRTRDAISLGWEARRRGLAWDRTLLRIVYPFPYRDLVTARAEELGLDPYLMAGIIRQESAFAPTAVSPAGAVGLMQVVPTTGRQLAGSIGPQPFRADFLKTPELNVHLGSQFLADLLIRYEGNLPLVLSAYNAGPTRANRWRRFPEAEDLLRFTERIPFRETRGYVKSVIRNQALYRWLYGEGG